MTYPHEEEISFDEPALQAEAKAIVDHFKKEIEPTYGPEDVDNLAETPLAHKELNEQVLEELYRATERRKANEKSEKFLKDEVKKLCGLERGMIQRGQYGVKLVDRKDRETVEWPRFLAMVRLWAKDQLKEEGVKEINRILGACTMTLPQAPAITPYVVGGQVSEDDT